MVIPLAGQDYEVVDDHSALAAVEHNERVEVEFGKTIAEGSGQDYRHIPVVPTSLRFHPAS